MNSTITAVPFFDEKTAAASPYSASGSNRIESIDTFRGLTVVVFDIKHYSLFTRVQEKRLHRVDERLFQAECLGKALKGNGWRGAVRHNSAVPNILRELRAL